MYSKQTTAIIAIALMLTVCAGIAFTDGSDADTAASEYSVAYNVDGKVYTVPFDKESTTVLKPIGDLGITAEGGKAFAGWCTAEPEDGKAPAGAVTYSAGSTVSAPTEGNELKVYALWTDIMFTVTFDVDGKLTQVTDLAYGSAISGEKIPETAKEGYIFVGWKIGDSEPVKALPEVTADVTYVAVYSVDHAVTFVVDGTTILTTSVSKLTQETMPEKPAKDGFEFTAWGVDGKAVDDPVTLVKTAVGDIRFDALWRADTLTVTYIADGETVLTQTVQYGERAVRPAMIPAKDGFEFTAWMIGDAAYDFAEPVTGDLVLTAGFSEIPAPEPTGLEDPMTLTIVSVLAIVIGALLVIGFLNKDRIRVKAAAWLSKKDGPKEGDGSA